MSKEFTLKYPITHDGKIYNSVFLNRMTGKVFMKLQRDLQAINQIPESEVEKREEESESTQFKLYAAIAGVPLAVMEMMDADDFIELAETAADFLPQKFLEQVQEAAMEKVKSDTSSSVPEISEKDPKTSGETEPTGDSGQGSQE